MKLTIILSLTLVVIMVLLTLNLAFPPYKSPQLKFDLSTEEVSTIELWSDPNESYLTRLRNEYKLDELVKDAKNDYEKARILTHWVANLWQHDGNSHPDVSDPFRILELVKQGNRYACVEYSIVLAGALNAIGIPARKLALKVSDVETHGPGAGHVVTEAYLKDLGKWVMLDGQIDAIPVLRGIPLNAVEFQKALANEIEGLVIDSMNDDLQKCPNQQQYLAWIAPYLYYFDFPLDHRYVDYPGKQKLMLVPIGAKKPMIFQKTTPIENMSYTHSLKLFYQRP